MNPSALPLSVAIPTYRREAVLLDTLEALLAMDPPAAEIFVVDQTEQHEPRTDARLRELDAGGAIRWLRLSPPSITRAMNAALTAATQDTVLFLDDDIRPEPSLLVAHVEAHCLHRGVLVAGRVLQPWHEGRTDLESGGFHFASPRAAQPREFMGGNFSVPRLTALALGGFDENFVKVAYRFEAEFARRWLDSHHAIRYVPEACLHHLKADSGGTRSYGEHLTTWRPDHAVGAYYYGLRCHAWREVAMRPVRSVCTRYHLRHPWRIPATLVAELRGAMWAVRLYRAGPRLLPAAGGHAP